VAIDGLMVGTGQQPVTSGFHVHHNNHSATLYIYIYFRSCPNATSFAGSLILGPTSFPGSLFGKMRDPRNEVGPNVNKPSHHGS